MLTVIALSCYVLALMCHEAACFGVFVPRGGATRVSSMTRTKSYSKYALRAPVGSRSRLHGWTEHDGLLVEERKKIEQEMEEWERIFSDAKIDGFRADYMLQNGKITDMGEAGIYGEIIPKGIRRLYDKIQLKENDVLYDLGSGTGKVPIQFAVETECNNNIGIELGETRHKASLRALDALRSSGKEYLMKSTEECSFYKGNILADDPCWTADATVLFICATAFPPPLMNPLIAKIRTCKTLRCVMLFTGEDSGNPALLDSETKKWTFTDTLCESSWDEQNSCHLYMR